MSSGIQDRNNKLVHVHNEPKKKSQRCQEEGNQKPKSDAPSVVITEDHEHVFLAEDQSFDEESSMRMKRCHCGLLIQVEEL
ncbi:conserved hypothetical protein [Ricinus communis]|uniref:Uncharacterized protein n=2 Tax=Ricinus communis TaxID=3988 RepID=B9T0Z5_RICCO|nr:conserved hypothetical protein [Ricinus communis]